MANFNIRLANETDLDAFWRVSVDTFTEAYADRNKPEDIVFYNTTYFNKPNIQKELEDHSNIIFVSENNDEITGYVRLKPTQEYNLPGAMEIKRIYVRKEHYGNGLGKVLMETAIDYARKNNYKHLVLAVWKENERAIAFYKKWGFKIHSETSFDWGTGKVDNDWVMVKEVPNS